jgi:hypothetical protein
MEESPDAYRKQVEVAQLAGQVVNDQQAQDVAVAAEQLREQEETAPAAGEHAPGPEPESSPPQSRKRNRTPEPETAETPTSSPDVQV